MLAFAAAFVAYTVGALWHHSCYNQ